MTQCERQLAIRDFISDKRVTNYRELMDEFGVSKPTIRNDLAAITAIACFEVISGRGGGIRAADGWFSGRRYLNPTQRELLERLSVGLQADDADTMQSILVAFGKPEVP